MGGQAVPDFAARPSSRVVIEDVTPQVDGGRFAAKRTVGEPVEVGATIFAEGHGLLGARVRYRYASEPAWRDVSMDALGNDRWSADVRTDRTSTRRTRPSVT